MALARDSIDKLRTIGAARRLDDDKVESLQMLGKRHMKTPSGVGAMRILKRVGAALVVLFVVAQVFRVDKSNPPVESDVSPPKQLKETMRRSCYGCHSNEVVWPWYAEVAPASWLVAHDVNEGRADLNFSIWGTYSPALRQKKLKEIGKTIAEGEMPPWYYVYPMHLDAGLSAADRDAFMGWVASESEVLKQQGSQPPTR